MATAEAAGSGNVPMSQLPWQQIPTFDPQTSDIQTYSRKLKFLREIWPTEHVALLAPRAALQVQGVAFQKVARLDASKLKTDKGVEYLVEALGGQWGKLDVEEKLSYFERAFYQTAQKNDESNDSYLARHDVAFEDLISHKIDMKEVRAYVLLRQSQISNEDRKRIIMESDGQLTYEAARKAIRLLGSRFFQELHGVQKNAKYKTYDTHQVDHGEEALLAQGETEEWEEEQAFQALLEWGDEDATFVSEFEDSMIDTIQESAELAACYNTYLEARTRLREKAKARGFWGPTSNTPGKGKGKKGKGQFGKGKSMPGKPKSLAERIATSACRKCGQYGHWKRECPLNGPMKSDIKNKGGAETISMTEAMTATEDDETNSFAFIQEMMDTLPEDAEDLGQMSPTMEGTKGKPDHVCDEVFIGEVMATHHGCYKTRDML